jgi:hypothetical protein
MTKYKKKYLDFLYKKSLFTSLVIKSHQRTLSHFKHQILNFFFFWDNFGLPGSADPIKSGSNFDPDPKHCRQQVHKLPECIGVFPGFHRNTVEDEVVSLCSALVLQKQL